MLFRVLVGLYSCVYVAQKNAKKIAYTSISAAIINITVDLILINKIQVFAASISTLVPMKTKIKNKLLRIIGGGYTESSTCYADYSERRAA